MAKSLVASARADIYTRITAEIVAAIEAGAGEWRMPWHHDGASTARPINVVSRKGYRGANVLALWAVAQAASYPIGLWGTYAQWQTVGAQVRKGERATAIVFWKTTRAKPDDTADPDETADERPRFFARGYNVFNQAQVDGYVAPEVAGLPETERLAMPRPSTSISAFRPSPAAPRPAMCPRRTRCSCRPSGLSTAPQTITAPSITKELTPRAPSTGSTGISPSGSRRRPGLSRNSSRYLDSLHQVRKLRQDLPR